MCSVALSLKDAEVEAALRGATVTFPAAGAMRVHKMPEAVYQPQRDPDGAPQPPGPNRFDDPHHRYPVRYLGETLRVCLLEVMARFRANSQADALLEQMTRGLDASELSDLADPEQVQGVADFLAANQVATFEPSPSRPTTRSVDVFHPDLLSALDGHHGVRAQLARQEVVDAYGDEHGDVHLDGSLIRNANRSVGRPVTQYISWLLFDVLHVRALRYYSRHSEGDEATCWAIHGDVPMTAEPIEHLDPSDGAHRDAVQYVATRYDLVLPPPWQAPLPSGCA